MKMNMEIKSNGKTFYIDSKMNDDNKQLVNLILTTESMDDKERQYWFDIIPSMNDDQIERLTNILQTERDKLDALEKRYQEEIAKLNQEHFNEVKDLSKEEIYNITFS